MRYSFRNTGAFAILFAFFMTACVVDAQSEVDSSPLPREPSSPSHVDASSTEANETSETTTSMRPQDASASRSDSMDDENDDANDEEPVSVEVEEDPGDDIDGFWGCAKATMKVAFSCSHAIDTCLKAQSVDECAEGESDKCAKALETWQEQCN